MMWAVLGCGVKGVLCGARCRGRLDLKKSLGRA